jgi:hypothetical protein
MSIVETLPQLLLTEHDWQGPGEQPKTDAVIGWNTAEKMIDMPAELALH